MTTPSEAVVTSFAKSATTTVSPLSSTSPKGSKGFWVIPISGTAYIGALDCTASTGAPIPSTGVCFEHADPSKFGVITSSGTVDLRVVLF